MKYKTLLEAMGAIEDERMVDSEVIFSAFKEGIEKAFRKHVRCPEATVRIDVDDNDEIRIFQVRTVVEDVDDDEIEISLDDAKEKNPNAQLDDKIEDEVSITEFSRSEITVVKNVMLQKIKEATKQIIYDEYIDKVDDMVTGTVESVEDKYVIVNLGKTLALLLKADQIPFERYKEGQRLKVVIKSVNKDSKSAQVLVSRASAVLVKRLFEISVPEIFDGTVEIKAIAREANERTKMAVYSKNPNVDAIGSCIGPRGNRVVTVIEEISQKNNVASHENIDIVEWNPDFIEYVSNVMKPANTVAVIPQSAGSLLIVVEDKDLSVAIGKKGINARLAAKLLDKKVEIKTVSAVEEMGIDYVEMMEQFKQQQQEKRLALEKEKLEAEVLKQQKELEEMNAKYQDVEEFDPEFTKDEQGRDLESYEDEDFVEKNENNPEKAETLKAKEESEENVDAAVTEEVEEEKPVKKKAKLQIKATDYVSKYEELADAKKKDTTATVKKKRKVKEEDQEALEIKEKLEALKKQQYEIKPEYTEEELDEFNNPEEEHWYDDDEDVDYDQYDEFYDN
ncbi:MAG: transcription termination factor NusA [Erysipelotrichaceae bacterium]|nr:transcription termination factor NusA [Erysipelotrichaceae bacterium]